VLNVPALLVGLLGLYPLGAGALKSCVNVFGAQRFHPVVQRDQIKTPLLTPSACVARAPTKRHR
jgi:hypothetical protein